MNRTVIDALKALERSTKLTQGERASVRLARELLNQVESDLLTATAHLEVNDAKQALAVLHLALGVEAPMKGGTPVIHEATFTKEDEPAPPCGVLDLLPALRRRQQEHQAQLYGQILESVKHLTD